LDVPQSLSREIAEYLMETFAKKFHLQDADSIPEASSDLFVDMNRGNPKYPSFSLRLQNDLLPDPPPTWFKYHPKWKTIPQRCL
jgi:hypothetical protein